MLLEETSTNGYLFGIPHTLGTGRGKGPHLLQEQDASV